MNQRRGPQTAVINPPPVAICFHDNSNELQIEITGHRRWYHRLLAAFPVLMFGAAFLVSLFTVVSPLIVFHDVGNRSVNLSPLGVTIIVLILLVLFALFPFLMLRAAWRNFMTVLVQRELFCVNEADWSITRDYGLWRSTRHFRAADVFNFHQFFVDDRPSIRGSLKLLLNERGSIGFRHKWWLVAIASGATEAEARQIVSAVLRRFPHLAGASNPESKKLVRPSARASWIVDQTAGALTLTISVKPNLGTLLELLWGFLFSLAWAGAFIAFAYAQYSAGKFTPSFLLLLMVFIAVGLLIAFWSVRELRWHFSGKEIVRVSASGIHIWDANLWLSRPSEFPAEHIYGLRYAPRIHSPQNYPGWFWRPGTWGAVAFDFGAGTFRFGNNLNAVEADEVLHVILTRFPQFSRDPSPSLCPPP